MFWRSRLIFLGLLEFSEKAFGILAIEVAIVSITSNASATLIDYGASTLDDDTGLEWLDLTETLGLSVNQALATTFVTNDGYRHATKDELNDLFLNAGFNTTNNVNDTANNPAAALLLGLMGVTDSPVGGKSDMGRGFAVFNETFTVRPNYHAGALGAGAAVISLFTSDKDLIAPNIPSGHFWSVIL